MQLCKVGQCKSVLCLLPLSVICYLFFVCEVYQLFVTWDIFSECFTFLCWTVYFFLEILNGNLFLPIVTHALEYFCWYQHIKILLCEMMIQWKCVVIKFAWWSGLRKVISSTNDELITYWHLTEHADHTTLSCFSFLFYILLDFSCSLYLQGERVLKKITCSCLDWN